ncbi:MAG: hypothetical protein COA38_15615 [Fluviicola sp.]|nr:MAG: hypothetical protein COA38_15615 [Fluviicola sp.]
MKKFIPKINRTIFNRSILDKQDAEGNNISVVKRIQAEIDSSDELYLFDIFMGICNNYDITFNAYQEKKHNGAIFKIIIKKSGYDIYTLEYKDGKRDVTLELVNKLYSVLWAEINNTLFVENVTRDNNNS